MSMHYETAATGNAATQDKAAGEYLTFVLGNEEYGIEILKVQEIRGYDNVTKIANTPDFIKGVVNLRGRIVPIVDLRIKFKLGKVEYDEFTVVIILNLNGRDIEDAQTFANRADGRPEAWQIVLQRGGRMFRTFVSG